MEGKASILSTGPAPEPRSEWALFLDIDGTLLEIAPRPEAVEVPPALPALLEAVSARLGGALGLVSGRPLATIDSLFAPLKLPCSAEHGAVIRLGDGTLHEAARDRAVPRAWREHIAEAVTGWDGVLIDDKVFTFSVHYRLAPERESDVLALVERMAAQDPSFEVLPARMAYEIRHKQLNKGEGIRELMRSTPFRGRVPVFVGDDATDEDGFRTVRSMNGHALLVADAFGGRPAEVRNWLQRFAFRR